MSLLEVLRVCVTGQPAEASRVSRGRSYCFDPTGTIGPEIGMIAVTTDPAEVLVQIRTAVAVPPELDEGLVCRVCLYACRLSAAVQMEYSDGRLIAISDHPAEDAGMSVDQFACYVQALSAACVVVEAGLNELRVHGLVSAATRMERVAAEEALRGSLYLAPFVGTRRIGGWDGDGLARLLRAVGVRAESLEDVGGTTTMLALLPTRNFTDLAGRNVVRAFVTCRGAEVRFEVPLPFEVPTHGGEDALLRLLMDICISTTLFQVEADPDGASYLVAEMFVAPDGLTERQLRRVVASLVEPIDRLDERLHELRSRPAWDLDEDPIP